LHLRSAVIYLPLKLQNALSKSFNIRAVHSIRNNCQKSETFCKESEVDLRIWAESFPAFFVSFDNLNFLTAARDIQLLNRSQLINYTAGYITFNPWSRSQTMFKQPAIDRSKLRNVDANTYIPTSADESHIRRIFQGTIHETLFKYCAEHLSSVSKHRTQMEPFVSPKIRPLPERLSFSYFQHSTKMKGMYLKSLRSYEKLFRRGTLMIFMFKGDLLTVRYPVVKGSSSPE
jgi:hypothetical protein